MVGTSASAAESLDSGEGTQGSDDPGGPGLDPELLEKVNKAMADMTKYSIGRALHQAKSSLRLPGPDSFEPGPLGLSLRVKQAMNQSMKQTPSGGTHALLSYEMINMLVIAERQKRITTEQALDARHEFDLLPVHFDNAPAISVRERIHALSNRHTITAHDACYLELGQRLNARLLTLDRDLLRLRHHYGWIG